MMTSNLSGLNETVPVKDKKHLSLIIPCYNEEEVISETLRQLQEHSLSLEHQGLSVEFIFIDDGSRDRTYELLQKARERDHRIKLLRFSRNFGHQVAVTAGIEVARGDAVVLIDADLQDPPEVIHEMVNLWKAGYDVVYGTRIQRAGESVLKLTTAYFFYRILNQLSDISIPRDTGDFRLMSRRVVDVLKAMPERDRFVRGLVSWVGFKQVSLPYKRKERLAGESKYPFLKMVRFALDGVLSFSKKPLQLAVWFGILCSLFSFFGILYIVFIRIFTSAWVTGWATLMIAILFIGGVQLISIGILGEYIGRIYHEGKRRPLYVVQDRLGLD